MAGGETQSTKPIRRFAVQPVETTTTSSRSSKKKPAESEEKPPRRFLPQPVETTTTSHRSSKNSAAENEAKTAPRRFLPQPVEMTTTSNRPSKIEGTSKPRRLLPQPEETTTRSSKAFKVTALSDSDSDDLPASASTSRRSSGGQRQFAPQLIETARRSRKSGDSVSAITPADKTDISPGDKIYQPRHMRLVRPTVAPLTAPDNTPMHSSNHVPQVPESRFSYASLSVRKPEKRKSFRVPSLEPITSAGDSDNESVESNVPSLSTTPSAVSDEAEISNKIRRIHTESRDGKDSKASGLLLTLAATAAKRQLQEQALAAFPNERYHEPVSHFAIEDDSVADEEEYHGVLEDPDFFQRRMSSAGWDLIEMQRHKEMLEERRRQQRSLVVDRPQKETEFDPWSNPYDFSTLHGGQRESNEKDTLGGALRDAGEVTKMRSAASPPMLGGDIRFPMSLSPQHTMMDPTQRPVCGRYGKSRCDRDRQNSGLWTPGGGSPVITRKSTSVAQNQYHEPAPTLGLWGGFCSNTEHHTVDVTVLKKDKGQSGLMTPRHERADPFSPAPTPSITPYHQLPITPKMIPQFDNHLEGIESVLELEATIDEEYPDVFVTQVYNYLSLGYPALAQEFDFELSKISRMPVEDIRRGDDKMDSKGHIGAPESEGWDEKRCVEECSRWAALRLYIREWARQQPKFRDDEHRRNARKGSWGL